VTLTEKKNLDAGLASVLISLIAYHFSHRGLFFATALVLLVACMTFPLLFAPFARLWFPVTERLGSCATKVLLTLVFFLMVTPVGLARRLLGRDPLQLSAWRRGTGSLFVSRNHRFLPDDLDKPF
jgi:hypothetical protein